LILGSGMGDLAAGALLTRAGVEVTILEAHPDWLGGWAHTFSLNGYTFTAGPRYLWNFGPGQIGQRFLQKCGLAARVPMVELDRRGFDHIYIGAEEPVCVPNGWSAYEAVLKDRFPGEAPGIGRFFALCRRVFPACELIDAKGLQLESWGAMLWKCFRRCPRSTLWLLLHPSFTLAQAFETCRLSAPVRQVLYGHGGIFALAPSRLSFSVYVAATLLYHLGCYYPANDMAGFVDALVERIERGNGRILRNQRVVAARASAHGIRHVRTQTAETFAADVVIVNFDPQTFLALIENTGSDGPRLPAYKYSASVSSLFLGVTDARILLPRFGNWNIWYSAGNEPLSGLYDADPLDEPGILYTNSPTLVKGRQDDAPAGHATVTAFAPCSYAACKRAGLTTAPVWKDKQAALLIDLIDRRFAPGLKEKLGAIHLRTPVDKEQLLHAPEGNIYGRPFEPRDVWTKLPFKGLLPNLYFTGAYVSFPGVASVIQGACRLYEQLTGDRV
jgi:all-trans-retinol 13,14-reductase